MTGDAIIQLLGALGAAGILGSVINAIFGRKKMSADVVKTINEAADSAVKRVEEDNKRLRLENHDLDVKVDGCIERARGAEERANAAERRAERLSDALIAYVSYAGRQTDVIRELGGVIDDPPVVPEELYSH